MNRSRLINITLKNDVMERWPDKISNSTPLTHLVKTSEERVFTAYNGCASNPTPRSVKARLPRSTLVGIAMEDVLRIASNIKIFPRIAGRMAVMLTIAVEMSRMAVSSGMVLDLQTKTLRNVRLR